MPLLKRPAAAAVASQPKAKQQKAEDPLSEKCDAIASMLLEAEGYTEATLQMLASSVQGCLMLPKAERHEVQNMVVEMISEVLSGIEAGYVQKLGAVQARIADSSAEKARREAEVEAALQAESDKVECVKVAETALEEAKEARLNVKFELGETITAQTEGDADLVQADGKKASAETALKEDFSSLKEGAASNVDASIASLTETAKQLSLEEQLIATAPVVLRKPVADRAAFDGVVIEQIEQQLRGAIAKLASQLLNGETDKAERAAKVQACQAKAEEAERHRDSCQEELKAARAALKEATVAKKAVEARVQEFGPEMEQAAASAASAEAVLVACKADLATFQELVDGTPAVPETLIAPAEAEDAAAAPEASTEA